MSDQNGNFTPALGHAGLTPVYDTAIAMFTRERRWRGMLLRQISPRSDDVILDVGCGTGTLAIMIKSAQPNALVVGLDPDMAVLSRAADKARRAGVDIQWERGLANAAGRFATIGVTKVVSSLVLHQTPMAEKRAGLAAMHAALRLGGELHLADYGQQRDLLMRTLFGIVQRLDGVENTQPNADGILPHLMGAVGFVDIAERQLRTPTGAISLYQARKPAPFAD